MFGISIGFKPVSGGSHVWYEMEFNIDSSGWQYLMGTVIPSVAFNQVDIYVMYQNNLNTAYFDGIQLYREEYGQSYQYDSNGNVTSTVDLAKQNTSFDYNTQNDLVKLTDPKGSFFTYEYSADGKRRLTKATSAENVVYSFEYDSYGNPRKAKVSGATSFMESSSTYTASGAYADTITDSSGNSVSYAYNESKGTLTSGTDPKGKTATYSYDSNTDALTGVSKTVDGSVVTNGYTYENDSLKTIAHNGFSYTFGYDALGNSTTVSAGSQTLITNSFDLRTGRLLESTYGNGHKVATDYDNLDRVATYKVWNSATGQYEVKFRYGYDASGNLGYLEDVVNSASYRYVYDLADRLVKISGSDGSSLTNGFDINNNVSGITETFGSVNNQDMAYNHVSNSSSVENPSFIASYAFDANNSSRCSSYATDNEWIYVDLGSSKSIGRVVLDWEYAYGKSYDIQVSNDATSWTTVFSTETGNGGIDDISGLSATGRYVRMNGRLRGTIYGYSLWSFEVYSGDSVTVNYEYDNDNRPKKVTLGSGAYGLTNYGELGRIDTSVISTGSATWTVNYAYHSGVNGSTTARVASVTNNGSAVSYTYDQNGNIETITDGTKFTKYYYNELNEVIREDNGYLNKSITYTYDAGGNILNKKEYAYTNGTLGAVLTTVAYTYGDTNWKDKLTAYNGKAITYDAIGNPLNYDGWTYTWENGRQLKSLSNVSTSLSFKYNFDGIRTEKTVNGVTTKYTVFGDKVSFETTGSDKIHYSYDASGNLFSMNMNGTEYYYTRNAQGDITGLIDNAGNLVVSYTYDTWGKLISTTGSLASTIGVKNPYRYRGYRYDTETGLYYLQSRYYNPDWGRFVNADDSGILEVDQDSLIENNLFVYALNNPVNSIDESGYITIEIYLIVQGISVAVTVISAVVLTINQRKNIAACINGYVTQTYENLKFVSQLFARTYSILYTKSKGKTNQKDTGLIGVSDEEIARALDDKSISKKRSHDFRKNKKHENNVM
ncbi:RHS repeat-associated core domain-containing protein [Youngiibacter multivorans]|uniref:RHS repeat-associated protein n=1 Tax=Youngiibacter multivorans TaxID=937251 RepID=A0ABS4G8K9_9CLOT|nr:RHS repeat-associated core domain-containing protein [Youngiibacter multivorans]MBP1920886.1 RHS repeat-associated protein [Youngiibacter multivorans]